MGAKLDLSFCLPGDQSWLRVVGQVVRQVTSENGRFQGGIAFLILRGEARDRIGAFVEYARRLSVPALLPPLPRASGVGGRASRE